MALTPATNIQIPDHAILDFYNKQAYLGNQFKANTDVVSLSGTDEVPLLYVSNPAVTGSGFPSGYKSIFNSVRKLICDDVTGATGIVYRIYKNPTVVSDGTVVTPINCRFASANTSIASVLKSPSVSTNGTLFATFSVGWENQNESGVMIIVDPGQSLLVTAQPTADTIAIADFTWYEL